MFETKQFCGIVVSRIIFSNSDSDFTIFEGTVGDCSAVFKGTHSSVLVGSLFDGRGVGRSDSFGKFYQMEYLVEHIPTSELEIEKYLKLLKIKGLGEKSCAKLAQLFGEDLFELVRLGDVDAVKVPGISKSKINLLFDELGKVVNKRAAHLFIIGLGVGSQLSAKILDTYGSRTEQILRENPYRLMFEVDGIGFEKADAIALKLGFSNNSPLRISSMIFYQLDLMCASTGSTSVSLQDFVFKCLNVLGSLIDREALLSELWALRKSDLVVVFENRGMIYLSKASDYRNEMIIAKNVWRLTDDLSYVRQSVSLERYLEYLKVTGNPVNLTSSQFRAVTAALCSNLSIIVGPPGTGKTFTTKLLIDVLVYFKSLDPDLVCLTAPTGMSSKILSDSTGMVAKTIHRVLKYQPDSDDFFYDEFEKMSKYSLIIIDEFGMVDSKMAAKLLQAICNQCQVIILGDQFQLESVDRGSVLRDLIEYGQIPVLELTEGRRFDDSSDISKCSKQINSGVMPSHINRSGGDCYFKIVKEVSAIKKEILNYYIKSQKMFSVPKEDVQILCPQVVGELGSVSISNYIKEFINPPETKETIYVNDTSFTVSDRVVLLTNMNEFEVYNGDIGVVESVNTSNNSLCVTIRDQSVKFTKSMLGNLALAYAISIHKSQGSEYPVVIMPFHTTQKRMLYRSLIFTGLTRAKKAFVGIGEPSAMRYASTVDASSKRETTLVGHLLEENFRVDKYDTISNFLSGVE